jgi:hypothetical protein
MQIYRPVSPVSLLWMSFSIVLWIEKCGEKSDIFYEYCGVKIFVLNLISCAFL